MKNFSNIQQKLHGFVKKYYTNELIKGAILFFSIGVLYFLFTLLVEHFLWLSSGLRTVLFWLFITVEIGLLTKFILFPLAQIFNLKKGIDFTQASKLIGQHFPEVNDKLLNVLQLKATNEASELLLASIDQKAAELNPVPFKKAVNYKTNVKYLKYALIPLVLILAIVFSGKLNWFSSSYERVVNYNLAYEPPAPFKFFVVNEQLETVENKSFTLFIETVGETMPENASISFNNETYFLESKAQGVFQYTFNQVTQATIFTLQANNVTSKPYTLNLVNAPQIVSFDMVLDYPAYTGNKDETLKSIGNAVIPQGTKVTWLVNTKSAKSIAIYAKDTLTFTPNKANQFTASKRIFNSYNYNLASSNNKLKDYENLAFNLKVIKDQFPNLDVAVKTDSLDLQTLYFFGKASDDYGLNKLQLVYYPLNNTENKSTKKINIPKGNFSEFVSSFPNDLEIEEGVPYELYFQVFDNDLSSKSTKSAVFSYRKRTLTEETDKLLEDQNKNIKDLGKSLNQIEQQEKDLEELAKNQREKKTLNFNDKKKIDEFLKRQKEQKKLMQDFNKKLKDNLEAFKKQQDPLKKNETSEFEKDLKKRLEQNKEALKQDEKLLKEIAELKKKFNKEKFTEKVDELAKKSKSKQKSLKQVLELMKRFFVKKKFEKLIAQFEDLGKEQEALSKKGKENTNPEQEKINKKLDALIKQLNEVDKDNRQLRKPLKLKRNKNIEANIKDDLKKASEALKNEAQSPSETEKQSEKQKAVKKQKSAAKQMKQMSQKMASAAQSSGEEQLEEDAAMLRQILDNLVAFSFGEEANMNDFSKITATNHSYSKYLKRQYVLKTNFEHIDDSLFALASRNPKIDEKVNTEIASVYFNIDKAINAFADANMGKGVGSQQYTITAANNLAEMLSNTLNKMQNQMGMPSPGKGEGGMPLPDIIISQEELNKQMEDALKKGKKGKEGEEGKDGDKGQQGEKGKPGDQGKEGEQGEQGESGKEGQSGKNGESGENGSKGSQGKQGNKPGKGEGNSEGEGDSNSKGKNGKSSTGKGQQNGDKKGDGKEGKFGDNGFREQNNGELFKIYQQQQLLRKALDERLEKEGLKRKGDASNLLRQMEQAELKILNSGVTNATLTKMKQIKHQLLKLQKAVLQQGEDTKRKSDTNTKEFETIQIKSIDKAKSYFNTTEILNKQNLPLQPIYKQKVQLYFNFKND